MSAAADENAAALAAAADLLALAMSESHIPVDVLGRSLERMAQALADFSRTIERQRALEGGRGAAAPLDKELEDCRDALEAEISVCIESLQFHDRLMQRLALVGDCLAGICGPAAVRREDLRRINLTEGSIELF